MKRLSCAIALLASVVSTSCNGDITGLEPPSNPATETFAPSLNVNIAQMTKLPNGVYIEDTRLGTGAEVVLLTDTIWVTYAGFLKTATLFDDGTNTKFIPAQLVAGFRTGVVGMKVGGKRKIVIPSSQGFGGTSQRDPSTGKITIPRQSTLVFDVELLKLHTADAATPPTALRIP